jgi:hypothetical protein
MVLCVRVLAPTEGLGSAALVGGVLQGIRADPCGCRTGQCADIGRMARVGLGCDTRHGIWVGTRRTVVR